MLIQSRRFIDQITCTLATTACKVVEASPIDEGGKVISLLVIHT